jgi:hypothetical protein
VTRLHVALHLALNVHVACASDRATECEWARERTRTRRSHGADCDKPTAKFVARTGGRLCYRKGIWTTTLNRHLELFFVIAAHRRSRGVSRAAGARRRGEWRREPQSLVRAPARVRSTRRDPVARAQASTRAAHCRFRCCYPSRGHAFDQRALGRWPRRESSTFARVVACSAPHYMDRQRSPK